MSKTKALPDYERKRFGKELRPSGPRTIPEGLEMFYPKLDREQLEDWEIRIKSETKADTDFLLFVSLLCGAQFWLREANATGALEELSFWLTSHPRRMSDELAELFVEAVGPGIIKGVVKRGWQIGPDGAYTQLSGPPERSRGAWTAAIVIQQHLRTVGVPKGESTDLSLALAAVLVGCETKDSSELTRAKRTTGKPDPGKLLGELEQEWQFWCEHAILKQQDAKTLKEGCDDVLGFFLDRFGALLYCQKAMDRMSRESWELFRKL